MNETYFIGIDVGTQGARVAAFNNGGAQLVMHEEVFELSEGARQEQDPQIWWDSCYRSLQRVCEDLSKITDISRVKAIGVTSTSGTIIPIDRTNQPLHPAIMYSDGRSAAEAINCKSAAIASGTTGYTAFNASSGLPKMLWFLRNYPEKINSLGGFIHAADFITGTLSGQFGFTDYTNTLKSGYDLHGMEWPGYIHASLGIKKDWLQNVLPSGTPLGTLQAVWAQQLGLSASVIVTAGITDGCASQVASGAVNPGDWNTTIGTTLVIKGVTHQEILDPSGAIYCHRHPEGFWMPGGASNTGADWVSSLFAGNNLELLANAAAKLIPGQHLAWPLLQKGERFPFVAPEARGFAPDGLSKEELFTAYMEGVAYIERYAFDKIRQLSGEKISRIFSAGGGANSDTWLRIRSNVLNLPVSKTENVSGAAGAAIVAASQTHFKSLREAVAAMVQVKKTIEPDQVLAGAYNNSYQKFVQVLKEKRYINE